MKTIGYDKKEIKQKFDDFYKDGQSNWSFDILDSMYLMKKNIIEPFLSKSKNVLDLGCAEGNFLTTVSNNKIYAVGVDISQTAINLAKEKDFYSELYVGYIDDTKKYTQTIKKYDMVLLNEVLYYVDNYIETLEKILQVSSKYIFISLAIGPQFFDKTDSNKIEEILKQYNYKMREKKIYNMSSRFGIPIRYWTYIYKIFRGIKLKQTYIYEK